MEAYGRLITNPQWQFFPAAVLIPVDSGYEWHMATFFYESCVDALIFLVLWFGVRKRKRWNGQLLAVYMLMYGIGRAVIEGLRMDSLYWGPVRVSQLLAGVSCAAAVCVLIWQRFRPHDKADLFVNQVAAQTAENAAQTQENETKE